MAIQTTGYQHATHYSTHMDISRNGDGPTPKATQTNRSEKCLRCFKLDLRPLLDLEIEFVGPLSLQKRNIQEHVLVSALTNM